MKKIKNNAQEVKTWCGQEIQPGDYYQIQSLEEKNWANNSLLLIDITSGDAVVNNGVIDIIDVNTAINFLKDNIPPDITIVSQPAFAAKTFGIYKLFKRVVGIQSAVTQGSNDIFYTVTFPWVKITGMEVIAAENLDTASFYVLDSVTGQVTGIPNYLLNQFGFTVNLSKDYYEHKSEFDADLNAGLQIKIVYVSASPKTIGINFIFNEVKS